MKNSLGKILGYAFLFCIYPSISFYGQTNNIPNYRFALVRDLSDSFESSLKLNPPPLPIDINIAKQQHENYIGLLEKLIPDVIRIDADPDHPDCNFIEDTAIIVGDITVISRMGAPERRGEEGPIASVLDKLGVRNIIHLRAPATMDGGDILYTGKHLFVGLSHRTNDYALDQLREIFEGKMAVIGIPVTEGLHLKSAISLFDSETLVVADTPAGMAIRHEIEISTGTVYTFVLVPDTTASNVLRIGSSLVVQDGYYPSEAILQQLCDEKSVTLYKINMSELIKADGALTCGSLLFNL